MPVLAHQEIKLRISVVLNALRRVVHAFHFGNHVIMRRFGIFGRHLGKDILEHAAEYLGIFQSVVEKLTFFPLIACRILRKLRLGVLRLRGIVCPCDFMRFSDLNCSTDVLLRRPAFGFAGKQSVSVRRRLEITVFPVSRQGIELFKAHVFILADVRRNRFRAVAVVNHEVDVRSSLAFIPALVCLGFVEFHACYGDKAVVFITVNKLFPITVKFCTA